MLFLFCRKLIIPGIINTGVQYKLMESKLDTSARGLAGVKFYQYISQSENSKGFEVIIMGGSYAGVSAALILARSYRRVLIIDSGNSGNMKVSKIYNFITHDNEPPANIIKIAKQQVLKYRTVKFIYDKVISLTQDKGLFYIESKLGEKYTAKKILCATGISDKAGNIAGFDECRGISIIHCPYWQGYEYKNQVIGILGNGNAAYEAARLLTTWTKKIVIFTNGNSILSEDQINTLNKYKVNIIETKITRFIHNNGQLKNIIFIDNSTYKLNALYTKIPFKQACDLPAIGLGCTLTEEGLIQVDSWQRTSVYGVFAAGDNSFPEKAISLSVASGTTAGMYINHELTEEAFL